MALFSASCLATEPKPEQSELEVGRYRFPYWTLDSVKASKTGEWKGYLGEQGVEWPEGSSAKFFPGIGILVVKNTRSNLDAVQDIMEKRLSSPLQVEVRMDWIEYKMEDIEGLARKDNLSKQALLALWKKGKGKLLNTSSLIGRVGCTPDIKAVTEYIYPTDFKVDTSSTTNAAGLSVIGGVVEPSAFEAREVGVYFGFTADLDPTGTTIDLALSPEKTYKPTWKDYDGSSKDGEARKDRPRIEQPFFHNHALATRVSVKDGATVRIGGGMNNRTGDKTVFAFLTATLLDLEGNPISKKEKRDED